MKRPAGLVVAAVLLAGAWPAKSVARPAAPLLCFGKKATIVADDSQTVGTPHDDVIIGSDGRDDIRGGRGNDRICGGDRVRGGAGDDLMDSDGGGLLEGGPGDDGLYVLKSNNLTRLDGGPGDDLLESRESYAWAVYDSASQGVKVDLVAGTARGQGRDRLVSVDGIRGTRYDDVLADDEDSNFILAGGGDDVVLGRGGSDRIEGAAGADELRGGSGKDDLETGYQDGLIDVVRGGEGRDYIEAYAGDDDFDGGSGRDLVSFWLSPGPVVVDLQAGTAQGDGQARLAGIEAVGGSVFDDKLIGDDQKNWLWGIEGNDELRGLEGDDVLGPGVGSDVVDGGDGADGVSYSSSFNSGVRIDLALGLVTEVDGAQDLLSSIEDAYGSPQADDITGDDGPNELYGSAGDDRITGGAGDDSIFGGYNSDSLDGGDGRDLLDGGPGRDQCVNGEQTSSCRTESGRLR